MTTETTFKKIDLHVHTPASCCYEDHVVPELRIHTTPEDIVAAARAAGLEAIAITDHNTVKGVAAIRAAAQGNGLVVWPGVEVTARGGHLLAIFDGEASLADVRLWLRSLGFGEEQEGDGFYPSGIWIDEVAAQVEGLGGLAIAAHVDRRPRGFAVSEEPIPVKVRIHSSPHLSALEITNPADKEAWNRGLMPNYSKGYACTQGSDAHGRHEMGRRPINILVQELTLAGLRQALAHHEVCLRFPHELDTA